MELTNRQQILVLIIIGILIFSVYTYIIYPPITPSLDPLPVPDKAPGDKVEPLEVETLILNATSIHFGGFTPHRGPFELGFDLALNVSNIGSHDIIDFHTVKASIFNQDLIHVYTFDMSNEENVTIEAETYIIQNYDVDKRVSRDTVFGVDFFLRLLVTFDNNKEVIITTPLTWFIPATE